MAVKLRNGVIDIDKIQIDNAIVAEYLAGLPESRREDAIVKAIGIGVLADIKGEITQFLNETEGELGKHLASLKTLYELRELRFKETSGKGEKAEQQIMQGTEFTLRSQVLPAVDILRSATSVNAELLGEEHQLGQIAPGYYADLLLVNGDPTKDIDLLASNGQDLSVILRDGKFIKQEV